VPDDKKQACGVTVELKLAGEAMDSRNRNKAENEATRFFFDTKFFLLTRSLFSTKLVVIGTIVPIPIPCTGLPLEAGLFCLLGGTEGGDPTQMQNEVLCCSQLLVGRSECVQCKIDWRVVEILGLTDRSKTTGQVIVWATVLGSVTFAAYFLACQ
jgi:hypothetical protein